MEIKDNLIKDILIDNCKKIPNIENPTIKVDYNDFGWALSKLKTGKKVSRKKWLT